MGFSLTNEERPELPELRTDGVSDTDAFLDAIERHQTAPTAGDALDRAAFPGAGGDPHDEGDQQVRPASRTSRTDVEASVAAGGEPVGTSLDGAALVEGPNSA